MSIQYYAACNYLYFSFELNLPGFKAISPHVPIIYDGKLNIAWLLFL